MNQEQKKPNKRIRSAYLIDIDMKLNRVDRRYSSTVGIQIFLLILFCSFHDISESAEKLVREICSKKRTPIMSFIKGVHKSLFPS